jgi:chemotaxis protein MotB
VAGAVHENHERWLVSYADFITLLFAFFVVMFATSQTDKSKAGKVSESVKGALDTGGFDGVMQQLLHPKTALNSGGAPQWKAPSGKTPQDNVDPAVAELVPSLQYLTRELEQEISSGKLQISMQRRGLVVSLREAGFFPSGEAGINNQAYPMLAKIAWTVAGLPNPVRVEGHTDSRPIHTGRFRDNWDLSAARATSMVQLLNERSGVPAQKMALAGFADTAPIDSNATPEGRAHNRRVDLVILNQHRIALEPGMEKPGTDLGR